MKALVQYIYANTHYAKVLSWSKLIVLTGSIQAVIQGIGLVCGILIIHILPTQQYALYTLANTMLGTMLVLADGGISTSVMAQGGKVWKDREKLGSVLATGFYLRKKFAVSSLLIAVPILFYLLRSHGADWQVSILIVAALAPAFFTDLSGKLLTVGPSLHQTIVPLQKINLSLSLFRLASLPLMLFLFPFAFIAILSASLPQIWANIRLRTISFHYADWNQKPNSLVRKEIFKVVKRILPGSVYYCLSSQITIWLISVLGTTAAVAQIGALSRLSMILNLFSATFTTLIIPRFARLANSRKLLFQKFLRISLGLLITFSLLIFIVSLIPSKVLWILGKNYANLEKELFLSVSGSCLSLFAGLLFTILTSRNWAINPIVSIPITLAAITCAALIIDISTVSGILKLNVFVSFTELVMYFSYCILKIKNVG